MAAVVFFWLIYSQFKSLWTALAGTAIFALGTSMWSTATRALWQHGPLVLMFTIVMLLTVRAIRRPALVQFAGLALAMAYIIRRPPRSPSSLSVSTCLRSIERGFCGMSAGPWLPPFPGSFSTIRFTARILPPYYAASRLAAPASFTDGLLGILFSPSRGLLVFTPVVVFAISGFVLFLARARTTAAPHRLRDHYCRHHFHHRRVAGGLVGRCLLWAPFYDGRCAVSGVFRRVQFPFADRRQPARKPVPFGGHRNFRRGRCPDPRSGRIALGDHGMELYSEQYRSKSLPPLGLEGSAVSSNPGRPLTISARREQRNDAVACRTKS